MEHFGTPEKDVTRPGAAGFFVDPRGSDAVPSGEPARSPPAVRPLPRVSAMTLRLFAAVCWTFALGLPLLPAAPPAPESTASAVDAALARGSTTAPRADDATFLRRVTLDLTGKLPEPDALGRFAADVAADKRAKVVDELLKTDAYAVNWGRYWRATVTYHTPASANYLRWKLFDDWWTAQLRRNRPWNEVVTALVTASGVNDELAPVKYLTALYGNPV